MYIESVLADTLSLLSYISQLNICLFWITEIVKELCCRNLNSLTKYCHMMMEKNWLELAWYGGGRSGCLRLGVGSWGGSKALAREQAKSLSESLLSWITLILWIHINDFFGWLYKGFSRYVMLFQFGTLAITADVQKVCCPWIRLHHSTLQIQWWCSECLAVKMSNKQRYAALWHLWKPSDLDSLSSPS